MAAVYRSSTSGNTGGTPASSIVVPMPAGVQTGDLILVSITADGGSGAAMPTVPAGWNQLFNGTQGTNIRLWIYGRIATGYETATYTWGLDTTRATSWVSAAYSGTAQFMPFAQSSANTTTASTTIAGAGPNSTYEGGRTVQIIAARNVTAPSTITSTGGYTKKEETCTTSGTFMNLELQETAAKGVPMGGVNANGATCSQTVNAILVAIFIEDSHPAFVTMDEDTFVVGSFSAARSSLTTSNWQTNYPNELLLAFVGINKDATTVSSITGAGLTWVLVARANTNAGSSEIWRAFSPVPLINQQMTITFSASTISGNIMFASIVGADMTGANGSGAVGATNTGSTTAAAPSISLTTTRSNSWVWAMGNEGTAAAGTITAGGGQTISRSNNDTTNAAASWMLRQNNLTATSGTIVTMNCTAPTTDNCNMAAIEILPAIRSSLSSLGVG